MADRFLVVDTETGGLDPREHSILTLGAVIWKDGGIEDTLDLMIAEPEINACPEALKINGLDLDDVRAHGLDPTTAVLTLQNFLLMNDLRGKVQLVAHNLPFDVGFIQRLFRLAGREYPFSHRGICTMSTALFLRLCKRHTANGASADVLFRYFGIDANRSDGHHRALDDAIGTAKLLTKLMECTRPEGRWMGETDGQG
jgi:DNA polymerase III epsilon subunit-like protein